MSGGQEREPLAREPLAIAGLTDLTPLGSGGFGTVYRAWQPGVGRQVAVKVNRRVLSDERDRRRFLREATAAGRLSSHAHVVAVHDAGITPDGRPYLVMELCPGGSLAELGRAHGPMPAGQVCRIGVGIADALATAHASGILHRDVKPGNILLDEYGVAKLADFGLAALLDADGDSSVTREALTPAYAPPEAFAFAAPSASGDVYALAASLYALLAGAPPRSPTWPPGSLAELSEELHRPVPPISGVDPAVNAVLLRALEPEPRRRTASAALLRDELSRVGSGPGGVAVAGVAAATLPAATLPAATMPATVPAAPAGRPGWYRWLLTTALSLLLVGVLAVFLVQPRHGGVPPAPDVAGGAAATAPAGPPAAGRSPAGSGTASANAANTASVLPEFLAPCTADPAATAMCLTRPLCWGGLIIRADRPDPARVLDCAAPHYWETYAVARLPGDQDGVSLTELHRDPLVGRTCTAAALAAAARTPAAGQWQREVQPQRFGGAWFAFCLAAPPEGGERSGAALAAPAPAAGS